MTIQTTTVLAPHDQAAGTVGRRSCPAYVLSLDG